MTKLPRGMSQLDYLWTNFGNYKVSEGIQSPPDPNSLITEKTLVDAIKSETGKYVQIPITSAESITRLNTIQTKGGGVDKEYSIEKGVQEAKKYTDDSLSWYEDK